MLANLIHNNIDCFYVVKSPNIKFCNRDFNMKSFYNQTKRTIVYNP